MTAATAPMLATIGDPEGTRTLTSLIALLVAMGLALVMVAIWLYRTTRPDPELLAPLEAMGERSWQRLDPVGQRRRLDELRPDGAEPISPSAAPPVLDAAFDAGPVAPGFDDLRDDGLRASGGASSGGDARPGSSGLPMVFADTPSQIDRPAAGADDADAGDGGTDGAPGEDGHHGAHGAHGAGADLDADGDRGRQGEVRDRSDTG